jgi:hypothetical protein
MIDDKGDINMINKDTVIIEGTIFKKNNEDIFINILKLGNLIEVLDTFTEEKMYDCNCISLKINKKTYETELSDVTISTNELTKKYHIITKDDISDVEIFKILFTKLINFQKHIKGE